MQPSNQNLDQTLLLMQKYLTLPDKTLSYTLKKSRRARRMRIAVGLDGSVVVTTPFSLGENVAERFLFAQAIEEV